MHWFCHAGCVPLPAAPPRSGCGDGCWPPGESSAPRSSSASALPAACGTPGRRPRPPRRRPAAAHPLPSHRPAAGRALRPGRRRRHDARDERRRGPGRGLRCSTQRCRSSTCTAAAVDPYDPEDMAVGADGTVWLADTGDNTGTPGHRRADRAASRRHHRAVPAHLSRRRRTTPRRCCWPRTARRTWSPRRCWGPAPCTGPARRSPPAARSRWARCSTVGLHADRDAGRTRGRAGQLMVTGGAVARRRAAPRRCGPTPTPTSGRWPAPTWRGPGRSPVRVPLPESPQGEAISFAADSRAAGRRQ